MGLLEPWHIIIIALAFLFFFGGKKIPELMRGLGRGMKEFKDAQNGETAPPPSNTTATEEKPKN